MPKHANNSNLSTHGYGQKAMECLHPLGNFVGPFYRHMSLTASEAYLDGWKWNIGTLPTQTGPANWSWLGKEPELRTPLTPTHNKDGHVTKGQNNELHCIIQHKEICVGLCLFTFKKFGIYPKTMSLQNLRSLCHHFKRLADLNSNYITSVIQICTLFTCDQASCI